MPTKKLTAATVEKLKAPQSGRVEYFDATFPAFGLRVSSSGRKSWIVFYRLHGKLRRYTIDTYPRKGLAEARKAASDILTKVEKGEDPVQEKKAAREAPSDRFGDVADQYLERDAKNNKGWQPIQNEIERELKPRWGDRPIHTIGKRDVLDLLDAKVDAGHPTAANRLLARIRRIFNWAVERGILEASPVQGIKAPAKETQRERVLSDNELQVLWEAAHRQGYPFGPLVL